ncbi:MAG: hypothetical protein AAF518_28545 [Spirochaetota bacterium]
MNKEISGILLNKNAWPIEQLSCVRTFHKQLYEWLDLPYEKYMAGAISKGRWQEDIFLPNGKAISPFSAGMCILEYKRTAVFVQGIYAAIHDALKKYSHRPIRILYAGTGPFAPLALLQTPYFSADEIQFTFLDVHEESLLYLQKLLQLHELEDYAETYIKGDATMFNPKNYPELEKKEKYDIIITEVMQRALEKEPQVAVTINLCKFLKPDGFFIPELVKVSLAYLIRGNDYIDEKNNTLIRKESWQGKTTLLRLGHRNLPDTNTRGKIRLGEIIVPDYYNKEMEPYLLTDITVYKENQLTKNDCSLNIPSPLRYDIQAGSKLEIIYKLDNVPGIAFEKILSTLE